MTLIPRSLRTWRTGCALVLALNARAVAAQRPETTAARGSVAGAVYDSVAGAPLPGASVQLVAADNIFGYVRSTTSDGRGRFRLDSVPDGRYLLGFFHPVLDSLGVQPPAREVVLARGGSVRADLAVPSPAQLRAAYCGRSPDLDSLGVLVGVVRDAAHAGALVSGATVVAEWLELAFTRQGLRRRTPSITATTAESGWFALCGVPPGGSIGLRASRGADSTDLLEVEIPGHGFVRRELYVGASRSVVADSGAREADSTRAGPRTIRSGDVRLRGTVIAAATGRSLPGAIVTIVGGPATRADDAGEWTIADAPAGTRMLEVRAVGYYPDRRIVHVVADGPPLLVALSTLKAVLDTVRVTARRVFDRDRNGFEQRRRMGMGRFVTREQLQKRHLINFSDIFLAMSGVRVLHDPITRERTLLVRGAVADWCKPSVYLDGHHMFAASADDIDGWIRPEHVTGVEVYVGNSAPMQYQRGFSGCGSIVIWTR